MGSSFSTTVSMQGGMDNGRVGDAQCLSTVKFSWMLGAMEGASSSSLGITDKI